MPAIPVSVKPGFYLGRADNNLPGEGGLIIDGTAGSGATLIKSNSSVVVRDGGDADRSIKVDGGVWARRACSVRVKANYLAGNPAAADCPGKDDVSRPLMTTDECTGRVADESCFPYLPRQGDATHAGGLFDLRTFTEPAWFTSVDTGNPFNPNAAPARRMTATPVPNCPATNAPGYVIFKPGYYSDLDSLDDRMNNCGDTLFYFTPGAYYFDFAPSSTQTAWTEPNGANGKLSQIVGGTGKSTGEGAWLPCNIGQNAGGPSSPTYDPRVLGTLAVGQCPRQPEKHMDFLLLNQSSQWKQPVETLAIDGTSDNATTNNTAAFIKWNNPQVRIPERSGTTVQRLTATIAYQSPSGANAYANGWPRLTVQLPGGANCDFKLPQYTTSGVVQNTFVLFTDRSGESASTCYNKTTGWDAKLAQVASDPSLVNGITLIYEVKSKQFQQPYVEGDVDGVSLGVEYTGRPAPDYPGGCDPKKLGVQFVLREQRTNELQREQRVRRTLRLQEPDGRQRPRPAGELRRRQVRDPRYMASPSSRPIHRGDT